MIIHSLLKVFKYCVYREPVEKYHAQRPVTLHLSRTSDNTKKCTKVFKYYAYCEHVKKYHAQRPVTLHLVTPVILHAQMYSSIVQFVHIVKM